MMKSGLKKISLVTCVCLILAMAFNAASACTNIYVGSALSADGSTIFGRSEDYANSQNKLFYVAESGKHAAGEEYAGCYGFTWTFTHDSYGYTAFSDDNGEGVDFVCPDCGGTHPHTPYEAAGTNEKGVSMTATETIYGSEEIEAADPYTDEGIEEAEITTVVLCEADSARAGIELLAGIYDTVGANNGSGIFIGDAAETWYIENVTGHQYVAVKLTDDMIMMQPNMVVIGEIDLDDTENVIASAGLVETAVAAGTFVGDQENNVINFVESYAGGTEPNARMKDGVCYLTGCGIDDETCSDPATYLITNLDENGSVAPVHTGIKPAQEKLTIADVQAFYHVPSIGYVRNLESHIFQIYDDTATGTVEWVAMNDTALAVFVPYLPMLTTDVYAAYKVSTPTAPFVEEEPTEGLYYPTTVNRRNEAGERVAVEGFKVLPDNWAESMYWTNDVLSNYVMFCGLDEATVSTVYEWVYNYQDGINEAFAGAKSELNDAESATAWSMTCAENAHNVAVGWVNDLLAD